MTTTAATTIKNATAQAAVSLHAQVPPELPDYVAAHVISKDDVVATAALVEIGKREVNELSPDLRCWIALGLALRTPRDGHTCVSLSGIRDWAGDIDLDQPGHLEWSADAGAWRESLASAGPLLGQPGSRAPFILDGDRLYLARSLHEEEQIARRLVGDGAENVQILLGGPGTGKTTQVAKRLIDLFREKPKTRIALAAPTGKAAARMAEALRNRLLDPDAPVEIKTAPPEVQAQVRAARPVTIHKLLGYRPHGTPRYAFNARNPLAYDVVVVDEASMLSGSLMYHLLAALGTETKLLLVGDPDQLASVDAGSVLGDVAKAAARPGSRLASRTEKLMVRHRFGPRIGGLADAILMEDPETATAQAMAILEGRWKCPPDPQNTAADDPASICWIESGSEDFKALVDEAVEHAAGVRTSAEEGDIAGALARQKNFQILCAHRAGRSGVTGWNELVERRLGLVGGTPWYAGRPLMVTRNNPSLDLFNGDIGLVVPSSDGRRMDAAFPADGQPRRVAVSRLEDVATVHALTIHRSQGSEYRHAVVVLPEKPSRILTRELLYTGVTRATKKVTIVGSRAVIEAAISRPIRRATGLADRL
jgi:exodeoxyribonuclease V alpha subunit